jgi:hypothetical protein
VKPIPRARIKRKAPRRVATADRAFLAWVKRQPCAVLGCVWQWAYPVEAHHAGDHGLSQRANDRTAIPLCSTIHHRAGPHSIHVLGKKFWAHHALDRDQLVARLNAAYDREHA